MPKNRNCDDAAPAERVAANPLVERLERNPKRTLFCMAAVLGMSIAANVVWSVMKKPEKRPEMDVSVSSFTLDPLSQGIGGIVRAGSSMAEAVQIRKDIEGLLAKDALTGRDSAELLAAFERLERINKSLLPIHKDER